MEYAPVRLCIGAPTVASRPVCHWAVPAREMDKEKEHTRMERPHVSATICVVAAALTVTTAEESQAVRGYRKPPVAPLPSPDIQLGFPLGAAPEAAGPSTVHGGLPCEAVTGHGEAPAVPWFAVTVPVTGCGPAYRPCGGDSISIGCSVYDLPSPWRSPGSSAPTGHTRSTM